jgi:tetratricopeptide (TPR) repeat protein
MWVSRPTRRWSVLVTFAVGAVLVLPAHAREKPTSGDGSTDIEARLELGRLYHEQVFQSLDRAIAEYEAVAKAQPDLAEARYYLALAYHTKGKLNADDAGLYRRAVVEYRAYLRLAPRGELVSAARQNIAAIEARLNQGGIKASPVAPPGRGRAGVRRAP